MFGPYNTSKFALEGLAVGRGPRLQVLLSRLMPTALMDVLLRTATGVPRRA
jgi:hypothetical protein